MNKYIVSIPIAGAIHIEVEATNTLEDFVQDFFAGMIIASLRPLVMRHNEHNTVARRLFFWMIGRYVPGDWSIGLWELEAQRKAEFHMKVWIPVIRSGRPDEYQADLASEDPNR